MLAYSCLFWIVLFATETLTLSEIFPYRVIIFCSRDDSELGEKMQDNFKKWLNKHFWSLDNFSFLIFFVAAPIFFLLYSKSSYITFMYYFIAWNHGKSVQRNQDENSWPRIWANELRKLELQEASFQKSSQSFKATEVFWIS